MSPLLNLALMALVIPSSVFAIPARSILERGAEPRATPLRILLGNDDGWAEANIRQLYDDLQQAGQNVILSASAEDGSGLGSLDVSYGPVEDAEFGSIPNGAPEAGFNATDPRLNYYNGTPVAAIKYGLSQLVSKFWNGALPDIVLSGPNVGNNLGAVTLISGTVGVATAAVEQGIPAIAFSGGGSVHQSYADLQPGDASHLYAQLAMPIINQVTSSAPFLPSGVALNVNFPAPSANCSSAADYKYVFTTIYPLVPSIMCSNNITTPAEANVIAAGGCLVSISAMGSDKLDVNTATQTTVFNKLKPILICADVNDNILSAIFPIRSL